MNAGLLGLLAELQQLGFHFGHHIAVVGQAVHRAGITAPVHQHIGAAAPRHQRPHLRIAKATGDIVDPVGPSFEAGLSHRRQERVDREQHIGWKLTIPAGLLQAPQHGQKPLKLDLSTHIGGARAGALRPEINQISALGGHALGGPERCFRGVKAAPITEGIRGDVQDSHHRGAVIWPHAAAAAVTTS